MKKSIVLIFIAVFSVSLVCAQNKPVKGTSGIGLNYRLGQIVSFPVFKYDYYLTNSWGLTAFYNPSFVATSLNFTNNDFTNKSKETRYSQSLGIGIEKHFFDKLKLDPFVGFSLSHGFSTKAKSTRESESSAIAGSITYTKDVNVTPMINTFTPAFNFGINYFIIKNFSLGMHINLGNSFSFVNGKQISTSLNRVSDLQGNVIQENNNTSINKINTFNSNLFYSVAIKTAFYFSLKKKEN